MTHFAHAPRETVKDWGLFALLMPLALGAVALGKLDDLRSALASKLAELKRRRGQR